MLRVRDLLLLQLPELLLVWSRSGVPKLDADLERDYLFIKTRLNFGFLY